MSNYRKIHSIFGRALAIIPLAIIPLAIILLTIGLISCGGDSNTGGSITRDPINITVPEEKPKLVFRTDKLTAFARTNSVSTNHTILRARYLEAAEVIIYKDPNPSSNFIATPLLLIPSGTGARADIHLNIDNLYNHNLIIVVGFRGVAPQDGLDACADSATFPQCLVNHKNLDQYNPLRTAMDIEEVMRLLATDTNISIDGNIVRPSVALPGIDFGNINVFAESYGGAVVTYLAELLNRNDPAFRIDKLVVDNPDGPRQAVITQGMEINRDRSRILKEECGKVPKCNINFATNINKSLEMWMEMHHDIPLNLSIGDTAYPAFYSSTLFQLWGEIWESDQSEILSLIPPFFALMSNLTLNISVPNLSINYTGEQYNGISKEVENIVQSPLTFNGPYQDNLINLTGPLFQSLLSRLPMEQRTNVKREFTNRIGLICSAYISATNNFDNQTNYNAAIGMPENSPWRYGFLIQYREMLRICPQLDRVGRIARISAPVASNQGLNIGAGLVYFGAMDDKHSRNSAASVASYFSNTQMVTENLRSQASGINGLSITSSVITRFFADGNHTAASEKVTTANEGGLSPAFP